MKKIGFLSFGHHRDVRGSRVRTAADALTGSIELAEAAEAAGMDGAWFRVHHFEKSLSSPIPLLAAAAARTSGLELGTGVIDLRYEHPVHLAEAAATADLISNGRLQLGISRGSPEVAVNGQEAFGTDLGPDQTWPKLTRQRGDVFRQALAGQPMAHSQMAAERDLGPDLPIQPHSPDLVSRTWWGAGSPSSGRWAGDEGYNLLSSTLLLADDGRPFHIQQADQIRSYREHYTASGHTTGGQSAVTRSVFPITNDEDRRYFLAQDESEDGRGILDNSQAVAGPTYAGEMDRVVERVARDEAVAEANYVLFALPSQLGVEYNTHLFENLVAMARQLGWKQD